ncbi:hypothetical protein DICSQDRAFT_63888, partial [Dichomitus squalens LYAD-421 SS1]
MASIKLTDDVIRVPKLDVSGTNWVLYKERLTWAADAKGLAGHLDGAVQEPNAPPSPATLASVTQTAPATGATTAAAGATITPAMTPDPAQVAYEAELATWKKGEAIVKQLIASTIPDSLFMKVRSKGTARDIW